MGYYKEKKQAQQGSMFFLVQLGQDRHGLFRNLPKHHFKCDFGLNFIQNVIHGVH
jgi:hypothetical protein